MSALATEFESRAGTTQCTILFRYCINIAFGSCDCPCATNGLVIHCEFPLIWHFTELASTDVDAYGFLETKRFSLTKFDVGIHLALAVIKKIDMVGSIGLPHCGFFKHFHFMQTPWPFLPGQWPMTQHWPASEVCWLPEWPRPRTAQYPQQRPRCCKGTYWDLLHWAHGLQ